jgi:hypothetical protein
VDEGEAMLWRRKPAEAQVTNVLRLPYAVAPRAWIKKFVETGVLRREDRNDAAAVERALAVVRQRTLEGLAGRIDE